MNTKSSKSKNIDRETLDNLMKVVLTRQFSEAAQNEEGDISLATLMNLWDKISDHEKTSTLSHENYDKKEEFNQLKDEIKNIIYEEINDKT